MWFGKIMLRWLKLLRGLSFHSLLLPLALTGMVSLAACGGGPLSLLTGGGPNVAANVQAGQTNTQTLGTTELKENRVVKSTADTIKQSSDKNNISTEKVDNLTVNQTPLWIIVLLVLGWLLPSPQEMGRSIKKIWTKRNP